MQKSPEELQMEGNRLRESNSPSANYASRNGVSVPKTQASLNEKLTFIIQQVSSTNNAMVKLTEKFSALEQPIDFVPNQLTDQVAEIADLRRENSNMNSKQDPGNSVRSAMMQAV